MNIRYNSTMKKVSIGFAAALVLLIIIACLLWRPSTGFFWVSALFMLLGYLAIYGTVMFYFYDGTKAFKEFPANYPLIRIAIEYSVFQILLVIVVSIINAVLPAGVKMRYYLALELALLLIFGVRYAIYNGGRKYSVELERQTKAKVTSIRVMTDKCNQVQQMVQDLPGSVQTEAGRLVRTMEEKVRYSDPMIHESLVGMDYDIERCIDEVATEVQRLLSESSQDLTRLRRKVTEVNNLIDTRNHRVKILK